MIITLILIKLTSYLTIYKNNSYTDSNLDYKLIYLKDFLFYYLLKEFTLKLFKIKKIIFLYNLFY